MPKKKSGKAKKCKWSVPKFERCIKDVKKSSPKYNPYAVCNNQCKKE